MKEPKAEFLQLASELSDEARTRILSRMRNKWLRHYLEAKVSEDQLIALQLEREEENTRLWQEKVMAMRLAELGHDEVSSEICAPRANAH